MTESGQISRIWKRWKADAKEDCFDQGASGLGLINLFTAWLILAGLAILAFVIALIEYYYWKKWGHKKALEQQANEEQDLKDSCIKEPKNLKNFFKELLGVFRGTKKGEIEILVIILFDTQKSRCISLILVLYFFQN